jgi:hypothetical protein
MTETVERARKKHQMRMIVFAVSGALLLFSYTYVYLYLM